jgi:hypothetical protein
MTWQVCAQNSFEEKYRSTASVVGTATRAPIPRAKRMNSSG